MTRRRTGSYKWVDVPFRGSVGLRGFGVKLLLTATM